MATYLVVPDDYAGWNAAGRYFALTSAAIATAGLLSWLSLHRHLGSFHPNAASDELFLWYLVWLGVGGFALMAFAAFGSILLSLKSRGTVDVSDEGVSRTVNARTHFLRWPEIQGLVPMPYGGITLVATDDNADIVIPRSLDDYRACIAEIKDHGIRAIPPSFLRQRQKTRKTTWQDILITFCFMSFLSFAASSKESHSVRVVSFSAAVAFTVWLVRDAWAKAELGIPQWINCVVLLCILLYGFGRMILTW